MLSSVSSKVCESGASLLALRSQAPQARRLPAPVYYSGLTGADHECSCAGAQHGHQLQYEAGLAVWQLTYYPPAKEAMGPAGIVPGLVDTVRIASKEKVRLCACITQLRCLVTSSSDLLRLGPTACGCGHGSCCRLLCWHCCLMLGWTRGRRAWAKRGPRRS